MRAAGPDGCSTADGLIKAFCDPARGRPVATAATRVRIPVHVAAALFDPSVPPPGQFAVHNALAGRKELFVLTAGHFDHPDAATELDELRHARLAFLHDS
jgi:cephalosporin-C deacetylase